MAAHLTEQEIQKIKKQFLALDEDGSGLVTMEELKSIFMDPRLKMTEADIEVLLQEFDIDGSGAIDISEFLVLMSNRKHKALHELFHKAIVLRSAIRKKFEEFDKNGDGFISKKEFRAVMRKSGNITEAHLEAMVKDADKNNDGKIDYNEFLIMMTKPN